MVVKAMNVDKLFRTRRLLLHYRQNFQVLYNNYNYFLHSKSAKIEFKSLTASSLLQSYMLVFVFLLLLFFSLFYYFSIYNLNLVMYFHFSNWNIFLFLKVSNSQKHIFLKFHCQKTNKIFDKILP
jgi:hypothetical protein